MLTFPVNPSSAPLFQQLAEGRVTERVISIRNLFPITPSPLTPYSEIMVVRDRAVQKIDYWSDWDSVAMFCSAARHGPHVEVSEALPSQMAQR